MGLGQKMKKSTSAWVVAGITVASVIGLVTLSQSAGDDKARQVRVGHFPNVTHAQALTLFGSGRFEKAFEGELTIERKVFNAGPSAVEALFAGSIDVAVMGPNPTVNAYIKSQGDAVRVVSGIAGGGAALVVRSGLNIQSAADFKGKKIASPQLGNTQDVALRAWLKASGLSYEGFQPDVTVQPLSNADIVTLLSKQEIDAAWVVEPWVSILVSKTGATVFLEEADLWAGGRYATSLLVVQRKFLEKNPETVKKIIELFVDETRWIELNKAEAGQIISKEIETLTGKPMEREILNSSLKRITLTVDPMVPTVLQQAEYAYQAGYLKEKPDLAELFDLSLLEGVLKDRKIEPEWTKEAPKVLPEASLDEPEKK